jgi:hypothetical protein
MRLRWRGQGACCGDDEAASAEARPALGSAETSGRRRGWLAQSHTRTCDRPREPFTLIERFFALFHGLPDAGGSPQALAADTDCMRNAGRKNLLHENNHTILALNTPSLVDSTVVCPHSSPEGATYDMGTVKV